MSRTYRRRNQPIPRWITHELHRIGDSYHWEYVPLDTNSQEYEKSVAKHKSDAGTTNFREPGPSWFRNMFTERPQRREAKRQLHRYKQDPDFEVILNEKDHLEYWT